MSEDFMSHTGIDWHGDVGTVQYGGGDKSMVVMFYTKAVQNPQKSSQAGRPIFEDQVFVRIHPPGERLNIVDRPAKQDDKRRWPIQWMQFHEHREQIPEGTPIDLLYPDQPSIAAGLRASGVHTVEQCAELSANAIETIGMGAQHHVNAAKKYLDAANKGIGASQLRRELDERDSKIRTLEHQLQLQKHQLDELQKAQSGTVDLQQIQALLAGIQGRPTMPMSGQPLAQQFDPQTAQINSVHTTKEVAQQKRTRQRVR